MQNCPLCRWELALQFFVGLVNRLFDLKDVAFRRHYLEQHPEASSKAAAAHAAKCNGELQFRLV